jgi:hypothetical protein
MPHSSDCRQEAPAKKPLVGLDRTASERQAAVNAAVVGDNTPKKRGNIPRRTREEMTSAENVENFDPLSPKRIAQAVCSEGPIAQPTYTSTAPSLYPSTTNTYVGKANIASLGFQFTGGLNGLRSPTTSTGTNLRTTTPSANRYQPEPSAPVWHAYHSSPPNVDIGSSPSASAYRRHSCTGAGTVPVPSSLR